MSLKKFYGLKTEADDPDVSDGVPQTIPNPKQSPFALKKLYQKGDIQKAGFGPQSSGVPTAMGDTGGGKKPAPVGEPIDQTTVPVSYTDRTIPVKTRMGADTSPPPSRTNVGGTGTPPKSAGPFSRAPNAVPIQRPEEPLPDLPLEGRSLGRMYNLPEKIQFRLPRRSGKLLEFYNIDEMPRPKGAFGGPTMAMLKWAKDHAGTEFTARDLFPIWRQAGGQANQRDERKAYQSFQTTLRQFIDPRGRGTPEQPLITVVKGVPGAHGNKGVYSWGSVRPSKTAAAKPTPGATPFDNMDLGPAGAPGQEPEPSPMDGNDDMELAPDEPMDLEPSDQEQEPEAEPEPEEEPDEDQFDWIPPTGDVEDIGVKGAMARLAAEQPDALQDILAAAYEADSAEDAAIKAMNLVKGGRNSTLRRDAIMVAKTAALNLGKPEEMDLKSKKR